MSLFGRRHPLPFAALAALGCATGLWLSCSHTSDPVPQLGKLGLRVPTAAPAPSADPTAAPSADDRSPEAEPTASRPSAFAGTVEEAVTQGCTTKIVEELSRQILEEAGCISPDAFVPVPPMDRVALDDVVLPYLSRPARDALARVAKEYPNDTLRITSMTRTVAQQLLLHEWFEMGRCGVTLAAKPGSSNHESGLAIDVSGPMGWRKRLERFGFRWLGKRDRWHFDYVDRSGKRHTRIGVQAFQRLWNRNHGDDRIREDGTFDASTERALRKAPAAGFVLGPSCNGPQPTAR